MRLLVLRHGQAKEAPPGGGGDIDRPLSRSGRASAAALGSVVQRLAPDLVLCSSALRARQTFEALELDGVDVSIEPGLYGAEVDEILEHVRGVDDHVSTVLLVGHNPGVHDLVIELTGGDRVPRFRPATLAVVGLEHDHWWEVGPSTGQIESLHVPDERAE